MKNEMLNKPNQLIAVKSQNQLTNIQRKAYNIFLKNAQNEVKFSELSKKNIKVENSYTFEIDCNLLHNKAGISIKDLKYIEKELENLMGMIVTIRDKEDKENWEKLSILPRIKKENHKYNYSLFGTIVKSLKEQTFFTSLNLFQIKNLKSQYSLILYELAIRYRKSKIPKMRTEEVRKITNTQDRYKDFYNFRKRVLDRACDEISEKTDIKLSYETKRNGREIAYINFKMEEKENLEELKQIESFKKIEEIKEIKYSEKVLNLYNILPKEDQLETRKKQLEKLLKEHSYEMLKADIKYCKKKSKKNFWGYFVKSINSGHYSIIEVEKEKAKEELVKKQKILEEHKKELKKQEKIFLEEQAKEMFENISENELNNYEKEYKKQEKILKRVGVNLESFIISEIKYKLEEKI
ncbi:MAG: hypothetical protein B6I28_03470 [Fusobacteriia bacterium 4572_132]|nr:MAG: hypothetical protein B6I28_03470 [Fusobacteriia bacterium 4572_132]